MAKAPGIYVKRQVAIDAHNANKGNPEAFKEHVCALIDAGNVLAVGEDSLEKVFDNSDDFKKWFDDMAPKNG